MKHTKGLWKTDIELRADEYRLQVVSVDGDLICTVFGATKERIANQDLIAAAPEMLEALEKLLISQTIAPKHIEAIVAVVNKARGES